MSDVSVNELEVKSLPNDLPADKPSTISVFKANILNYGAFILYIAAYVMIIFGLTAIFDDMSANIIGNAIMTVPSLVIYFKCKKKGIPSFQSYSPFSMVRNLMWMLFIIIVSFVLLILFQWFGLHVAENIVQSKVDYPIWYYLFFSCVIAPLSEESIIRLYSYNMLKRSSNWIIAMGVSSFVFAILHGTISHMVLATVFGIVLTLSYEATGCFWVPIVGHSLYNLMTLYLGDKINLGSNNTVVIISASIFGIILLLLLTLFSAKMSLIPYQDVYKKKK